MASIGVTVQRTTRTVTLVNQGPAGVGIIAGGTTGQVLQKASGADYDMQWGSAGTGDLLSTNNLSDVANVATARSNLGLGTADSPFFSNLTASGGSITLGSAILQGSATFHDGGGETAQLSAPALTGGSTTLQFPTASGTLALTAQADGSIDYTDVTNIPSATMQRVGASTYSTLQHMQDIFHSSGSSSGGAVTDGGSNTVNVAAGTGFIRSADDPLGVLYYFDWGAASGLSVPSGATRYVGVEYNAGSPQATVRTTDSYNANDEFLLAIACNEGGTISVTNVPHAVGDHAGNMILRTHETMGIARDKETGGLVLGETGTRNLTLTTGALWDRLAKFTITAKDTSVADNFDRYYRDGVGGYTKQTGQTQWDNTQYDDGSGTLAVMTANRYACQWFYVDLNDNLISVYGTNQYSTIADAQDESPPTAVPDRVQIQSILVAKLIFQKSAASATEILSAFGTTFSGAVVTDHGTLSGLSDDDHPQYLLIDGTRAMSGALDMDSRNIEWSAGGPYFQRSGNNLEFYGGGGSGKFVIAGDLEVWGSVSNNTLDTLIKADASQNIDMVLGDALGTNKLSIQDSGSVEVAYLDSEGRAYLNLPGSAGVALDLNDGQLDSCGDIFMSTGGGIQWGGAILSADGTSPNQGFNFQPEGTGVTRVVGDLFATQFTATSTLQLSAQAGQDINVTLGDFAGATNLVFKSTLPSTIATLTSGGKFSCNIIELDGGALDIKQGANYVSLAADVSGNLILSPFGTAANVNFSGLDLIGLDNLVAQAGGALNIAAASGQNLELKFGDAAGANKISFLSSAGSECAYLDSSATLHLGGLASGAAGELRIQAGSGSDWFTVGTVGSGVVQFNSAGGITRAGVSDLGCRFNISPVSDSIPAFGIRGTSPYSSDLMRVSSGAVTTGDYFKITGSGGVEIGNTLTMGGSILSASATDLTMAAASGQDVDIKLGDAAGSNRLDILDSTGASTGTYILSNGYVFANTLLEAVYDGGVGTLGGTLQLKKTGTFTGSDTAGRITFMYGTDSLAGIECIRGSTSEAGYLVFSTQKTTVGGIQPRLWITEDGEIISQSPLTLRSSSNDDINLIPNGTGKISLQANTELDSTSDLVFTEKADHSSTPAAGFGYMWVKSSTPNVLYFTDDAGTDHNLLAATTDTISVTFDGGGSAITAGSQAIIYIPYACTIEEVTMLGDVSGSIVIDLWVDSYANHPPTDVDSITASAVPTISTATKSQDSTLTGWTTSIAAGSVLIANVDSASTITFCHLALKVTKT